MKKFYRLYATGALIGFIILLRIYAPYLSDGALSICPTLFMFEAFLYDGRKNADNFGWWYFISTMMLVATIIVGLIMWAVVTVETQNYFYATFYPMILLTSLAMLVNLYKIRKNGL